MLAAASSTPPTDLDGLAVVALQQDHPVDPAVVAVEQVEQVVEVAEALRHLLAGLVDDHPVVHPVVGEALAEGDRLGPLVLVVREAQILAAGVQVEALAEQAQAHHDALAVPARPPSPHGDGHAGSPGLASFHSTKSAGMLLELGAEDLALAAAGEHLVERLVGEQAVVLDGLDGQVHAVVGRVGAADLDELADHLDHLGDVRRGVGDVVGPGVADAVHRLPPHRLALGGDVLPRAALVVGPVDDLVVDVGDVGDELHVEAAPAQVAHEHVVLQRRPPVADVGRPVHRRPAQVDAHLARLAQGQLAHLAGRRVVEAEALHKARAHGPTARDGPRMRLLILSGMAGVPEKPTLDGIEARWAERLGRRRRVPLRPRGAARDDVFAVDTPPPTVSGSLHVGTIFGYTQFDAMARYQRMRGKQVFFPIGWDDNGLATERRVQNFYGVRCDPASAVRRRSSRRHTAATSRRAPTSSRSRGRTSSSCAMS